MEAENASSDVEVRDMHLADAHQSVKSLLTPVDVEGEGALDGWDREGNAFCDATGALGPPSTQRFSWGRTPSCTSGADIAHMFSPLHEGSASSLRFAAHLPVPGSQPFAHVGTIGHRL